jgi:hypothetical protein
MRLQAQEASHTDDIILAVKHWLFARSIVIPAPRRLLELSRAAFAQIEEHVVACVSKAVPAAMAKQLIRAVYMPRPPDNASHIEWLKAGPKRHSPTTLAQTLEKVHYLKSLDTHDWDLGAVVLAKQQAYARQIQARRPAKSREIQPTIQLVEVVCFLRVKLLELTDTALHLASRRSQQLLRTATERAESQRSSEAANLLKQAVQVRSVLHDETKDWQQRVIEAQRLLVGIGGSSVPTFAARIRAALA